MSIKIKHKFIPKIKRGDFVKIISGSSKNKTGKVIKLKFFRNKNRAFNFGCWRAKIEGCAFVTKYVSGKKPNKDFSEPGMYKIESFIDVSNVKLLDS